MITRTDINLMILLILLLDSCKVQWVTWREQTGHVPSYIYQFTMEAGDQLAVQMQWPGFEDLDLYLYSQGMDLLNPGTYIQRAFSATANPEYIFWTATGPNTYYVRCDLYSDEPTGYYIKILVNGQQIIKDQDTVIKVFAGVTARQLNIGGDCTMRISYTGPDYQFLLFPPNSYVLDPNEAVLSGQSGSVYQFSPSQIGNWYIIIDHLIYSTTELQDFTLLIQTDTSRPCRTFCQTIQHTVDMVPGAQNACICQTSFLWQGSVCSINCTNIAHATSRLTYDSCNCQNGYSWNSTLFSCMRSCDMDYAVGFLNDDPQSQICQCQTNFTWNSTLQKCVINCSLFNNTLRNNNSYVDVCICKNNFMWNTTILSCIFSCHAIPNAMNITGLLNIILYIEQNDVEIPIIQYNYSGNVSIYFESQYGVNLNDQGSIGQIQYCLCQNKFRWMDSYQYPYQNIAIGCYIQCGNQYIEMSTEEVNRTSCECRDGFYWENFSLQCQINCSMIQNATGIVDLRTCSCQRGFIWNPANFSCNESEEEQQTFISLVDCRKVQNSLASVGFFFGNDTDDPFNNTFNNDDGDNNDNDRDYEYQYVQYSQTGSCRCVEGYQWMMLTKTCEYDDILFIIISGSLSGVIIIITVVMMVYSSNYAHRNRVMHDASLQSATQVPIKQFQPKITSHIHKTKRQQVSISKVSDDDNQSSSQ